MRVFYAPYKLTPSKNFTGVYKESEGILLKIIDSAGAESYSLYHPILNLGDVPIETFLKSKSKRSSLLERIQKLSIREGEVLTGEVESYYLASSLDDLLADAVKIADAGFRTVKLKTESLSKVDVSELDPVPFDFILDFNGRETLKNFNVLDDRALRFLESRVRYIEDPFQLNDLANLNVDFKSRSKFKIASDFIDYGVLADYKIVKPSGFNHQSLTEAEIKRAGGSLVATSYLDHPLGQFLSAKWAFEHDLQNPCGLWTHTLYNPTPYSQLFNAKGAAIDLKVKDSFLSLLKCEDWKEL